MIILKTHKQMLVTLLHITYKIEEKCISSPSVNLVLVLQIQFWSRAVFLLK